jgi:hypothetical protein
LRERATRLHLVLKTKESVAGIPICSGRDYAYLEDCSTLGIRIVRERPVLGDRASVNRPSDLEGFSERLYSGK